MGADDIRPHHARGVRRGRRRPHRQRDCGNRHRSAAGDRVGDPDALASIGIGLTLGTVAVFLVERNRDFLVGQEVSPAGREHIRAFIAGWPGVVAVRSLIAIFTGPDEILVSARVDIDDTLDGAAVEHLVSDIERELRAREPSIIRVDVVPTG